ncbi:MAG: FadR family transcriptional regulator [Sphingomonadaceae bacterium]|nr:FadR family transcriptional regulator [Sphingomonadaceae bacterium]
MADAQALGRVAMIPNEGGVRVQKAAELVADQIRRAIIRGTLRDGDSLPAEAHLIAEYQVSRPTIREAIRILESEGLIAVSRGARGGARISSPTFALVARAAGVTLQSKGATLGDIYEARTIIEPPAARLVAMRGGADAVATLRRQLDHELTLVGDRIAASLAIADFHRILVELCGNVTLTMLAHSLQDLVERHLALSQRRETSRDEAALAKRMRFGLRSHAKLIEYVEKGDGEGAELHWHNHMRAAGVYWLQSVAPTSVVELLE